MRDIVRAEGGRARKRLDRIDLLDVGEGALDAHAFARGDESGGTAGGALDYDHRISEELSAFASAWAGVRYGDESRVEYGASAGARWQF